MRPFFVTICGALLILGMAGPLHAADLTAGLVKDVRQELPVFGDEAVQVIKTPVDTDGYGMLGTLAALGGAGLTYIYDGDIRTKVQGARGKSLDRAADAGSIIGNPFLHVGVAATVYAGGLLADAPKYRELGEMLGEASLLADATTLVLKEAVGRQRPYAGGDRGSFRPFQFKSDYDSFPSMHTASSFAMASVLAATSDSLLARVGYYALATFVGFSRLEKEQHWASDIVFGAAVGELCGRIVTTTHASNSARRITLVPTASADGGGLMLIGRW